MPTIETGDPELDDLLGLALSPTATDDERQELADYAAALVDCLTDVVAERDAAAEIGARVIMRMVVSVGREWPGEIPERVMSRFVRSTLADFANGRFAERCQQFVEDREAAET